MIRQYNQPGYTYNQIGVLYNGIAGGIVLCNVSDDLALTDRYVPQRNINKYLWVEGKLTNKDDMPYLNHGHL